MRKNAYELVPKTVSLLKLIAEVRGIPFEPEVARFSGDGEFNRCYWNVQEKVRSHGGEALYCWRPVWVKGAYIWAQHHAVWRRPDDQLIDLTPLGIVAARPWINLIVDRTFEPDFSSGAPRIPNIVVNLCGSPLVDRLSKLDLQISEMERQFQGRVVSRDVAAPLAAAQQEYIDLRNAIIAGKR